MVILIYFNIFKVHISQELQFCWTFQEVCIQVDFCMSEPRWQQGEFHVQFISTIT